TALEAVIHIQSSKGEREVAISDFFLLPGDTPEKETVLEPGELITAVTLKPLPKGTRSHYLKLRDRASYEFAISSAAIVATMNGGKIERIRIAMGGVGTKPWRSLEAEKMLEGTQASEEKFKEAAAVFLRGAKPASENGFKLETAERCLVYALKQATKA
ncbi:MAG: xanthine dehydrogenase family protein subunit M, partial [Proteobacteria bacterium]